MSGAGSVVGISRKIFTFRLARTEDEFRDTEGKYHPCFMFTKVYGFSGTSWTGDKERVLGGEPSTERSETEEGLRGNKDFVSSNKVGVLKT